MHDEYVYPQWLDTSDNDQLERAVISYHAKGMALLEEYLAKQARFESEFGA